MPNVYGMGFRVPYCYWHPPETSNCLSSDESKERERHLFRWSNIHFILVIGNRSYLACLHLLSLWATYPYVSYSADRTVWVDVKRCHFEFPSARRFAHPVWGVDRST
ncbi:hypothetical protein GW17_00035190 [Ensete ventricosum]|nr:hypothetical protein GW17_00035190 [Ensete ventricosum]